MAKSAWEEALDIVNKIKNQATGTVNNVVQNFNQPRPIVGGLVNQAIQRTQQQFQVPQTTVQSKPLINQQTQRQISNFRLPQQSFGSIKITPPTLRETGNFLGNQIGQSISRTNQFATTLGQNKPLRDFTPEERRIVTESIPFVVGNAGGFGFKTSNLKNFLQQTGKYGTQMRTINPYQGTKDVKGLFEIAVKNQKTGKTVRRLKFNSLNDAKKAMERVAVGKDEIALPINELIPEGGLGLNVGRLKRKPIAEAGLYDTGGKVPKNLQEEAKIAQQSKTFQEFKTKMIERESRNPTGFLDKLQKSGAPKDMQGYMGKPRVSVKSFYDYVKPRVAQPTKGGVMGKAGGVSKQVVRKLSPSQRTAQQLQEYQAIAQKPSASGGGISSGAPKTPSGQSGSSKPSIPQDKYAFNINKERLALNKAQKETLDKVVESVKPELQKAKGKTLSNKEVIREAKKSDVLREVTTREDTLKVEAAILKSRQKIVELNKNIDRLAKEGKTQEMQAQMRELLQNIRTVSATAGDTGRRLKSFSIEAGDEGIRTALLKDLSKTNASTDDILREAAKVDWNNANSIATFYRKFVKPSWLEVLDEYRYNNMLSSPRTHMRNAFSNLTQTTITRPGVLIFEGKPYEAGKYLKGMARSFPDAVDDFVKSFKGQKALAKPDIEMIPTQKIPRFFTIPTRLMEAGDRFFSRLIAGGEMARGIAPNKASKTAEYYLFRQGLKPEGQGAVLNAIDDLTAWTYKAPKPVRWFVPFIRTPMNFAKQWIEFSPTGFTTAMGAANPREQVAKAMMGSLVTAVGAQLAFSGKTTWAAPTDPTQKEYFYASGRKPFSIQVGDKWIPMIYAGPFAMALALPAAFKYYQEDSKDALVDSDLDKATQIVMSMANFLSQQTFLSNIGNFVNFLSGDVDYTLPSNLGFTAGQLIPMNALVSYVNTIVDPVYRKGGGFVESIQKNIPGLSQGLEPYTEPSGDISTRDPHNYFLPFDIGTESRGYEQGYQQAAELGQITRQRSLKQRETKNEAQSIRQSFEGLTTQQKSQKWEELVRTDPSMARRVKDIVEAERLGLTGIDKKIKSLGVEDGTRAKYLYQEFQKLKSSQEKDKLWQDLVRKKIITKQVSKQIKYLIQTRR